VVEKGEGRILANVRQINYSAYDRVIEIIEQAGKTGLGGCFPPSGEIDESLFGAPVEIGKFGIAIVGGINGICALEETGIEIETNPVSMIMEYKTMSEI
jgi:repressor of nif and glnA expression